jgi:hypothetical protein
MRLAGASDQVVQHRMRHTHRATTSDIYGWTPDIMDKMAVEALEAVPKVSAPEGPICHPRGEPDNYADIHYEHTGTTQ